MRRHRQPDSLRCFAPKKTVPHVKGAPRRIGSYNSKVRFHACSSVGTRSIYVSHPLLYHFKGDSLSWASETEGKLTQLALVVQGWRDGGGGVGLACLPLGSIVTVENQLEQPCKIQLNLALPLKT